MKEQHSEASKSDEPASLSGGFRCPHCSALAQMTWFSADPLSASSSEFGGRVWRVNCARCQACHQVSIWLGRQKIYQGGYLFDRAGDPRMVYPIRLAVEVEPNPDLPNEIAQDFREAATIAGASPRGAAALLRLCLQKLCEHLLGGRSTHRIFNDIGLLVKDGLDPSVQMALDYVRIAGNDSVHAGTISVQDDPAIVATLFNLINLVANDRITRPKQIAAMYESIPESKRRSIEKRDT